MLTPMLTIAFEWDWLGNGKLIAAAAALALLWLIEAIIPMFPERGRKISHDASNLALGLINAIVTAVLFAGAVLFITEWAREHNVGLIHWLATRSQNEQGETPAWITWVAWPLALILFDAWMYLWHVLNHKVPLLWRFHAVHHADRELNVTSAVRFHTGEIILSGVARLAVLPVLGMTLPQLLLYEALLLPVILFHHSNVRVPRRLDDFLRWIIVTPWMHWVHHSNWQPETDSNYASILSIWDRIFGTFRLRDDPLQMTLGLTDDREEKHWRTLPGMLARPFRRTNRPTDDEDARRG